MTLPVVVAIIAGLTGSGVSSLIQFLISRSDKKKNCESEEMKAQSEMLVGLGHDRIVYLGQKYLERGSLTLNEYENLSKYLYKPYKKLGGNGTAEKIMEQVDKLQITEDKK